MRLHFFFSVSVFSYRKWALNYTQVADYINVFSYQEAKHMLLPISGI